MVRWGWHWFGRSWQVNRQKIECKDEEQGGGKLIFIECLLLLSIRLDI